MHVNKVDADELAARPLEERYVQNLVGLASGSAACSVSWIRTPVGGGSPEGLHVHAVDQIFYVLEGRMSVEMDGEVHTLEPGGLVLFPANQPHRNWNAGEVATVHLAINAPAPEPGVPFARPWQGS